MRRFPAIAAAVCALAVLSTPALAAGRPPAAAAGGAVHRGAFFGGAQGGMPEPSTVAFPDPAANHAPVPMPPGGTTVLRWGSYFGATVVPGNGRDNSPVPVSLPAPIQQLSTSNSTEYALLDNGQVWAWGFGGDGQLGNGADADSLTTPVRVHFPPGVTIAFLPQDVNPYDSAMAVDADGNVWAWGRNRGGEFCNGTDHGSDVPLPLPLPGPVTMLAGADDHMLYLVHGAVYTCGANLDGATGLGATTGRQETAAAVPGLPSRGIVAALTASFGNSGVLYSGGAYYDWGMNTAGQDGLGYAGAPVASPQQVPLPPVSQAYEGGSLPGNGQTLARLADGALYAWGSNSEGQLGTGSTASEDFPVPFSAPGGVTYVSLATAGTTSYALDARGNVWAWGGGAYGQMGTGTAKSRLKPAKVVTGASMINATANNVEAA